jgi:dTDP-glucose 4,6-dehydratase
VRVLLTGAAGFIAAHTVEHFLENTDWDIVGWDSLEHKGDIKRIERFIGPRFEFCKINIGKDPLVYQKFDVIINMASDSHVDRSIDNPVPFVKNNYNLTLEMLEYARFVKPEMFIQISTDEVYGPMLKAPHPEWDTMLPSNPYSASKAAQEALAIAWWRTYGVPVVITNTMNNYGPDQDFEKYIPMVIKKLQNKEVIEVHGTEADIGSRFYLHAKDHADALMYIIQNLPAAKFGKADRPDRYNIVGGSQINNLEMAETIARAAELPLQYELVDFHSTRPGHDPHYGLTGAKLKRTGWELKIPFEIGIEQTVKWYLG